MTSSLDNHIHLLIADYLRRNNHLSALKQLEIDLNTPLTNDDTDDLDSKPTTINESLESIVSDRFTYLSLKDKIESENKPVYDPRIDSIPNWSLTDTLTTSHSLNLNGKYPHTLIIHSSYWDSHIDGKSISFGLFVSNDKTIYIHDLTTDSTLLCIDNYHGKSTQIKTIIGIPNSQYLITIGMDGLFKLSKLSNSHLEVVFERQLHKRLVVDVNYLPINKESGYLVSIGWDRQLSINRLDLVDGTIEPLDSYKLLSIPTCLYSFYLNSKPLIMIGRLDTSIVSLFLIEKDNLLEIAKLSLNDSQFSTHSFHPTHITQLTSNIFTFATNHIPYMRLISIELPTTIVDSILDNDSLEKLSALSIDHEQTLHSSIPIQREIIVSNINSMSPQDKYSSSLILSRSQINSILNGVWVLGDDGSLRGINVRTGEVIKSLKTHEGRIKTGFGFMASGYKDGKEEILVTCGAIDKCIKIWK